MAFVSVVLKRDQLSSEVRKFSAELEMDFFKPSKSTLLWSKILCGGLNDLEL